MALRLTLLIALQCAAVLAPQMAYAQPVFVEGASLYSEGSEVGWLRGAPANLTSWPTDRRPELHFEDEAIALDAEVDLSLSDTSLLASPAAPATLEPARVFRVEMLPETFARVVRRDSRGRVRIRLPAGLPHRGAAMPVGSLATQTTGPRGRDPDEPDGDAWLPVCETLDVLALPRRDAPTWSIDGGSQTVVAEVGPRDRRGYRPVRVWVAGYIVHGFIKRGLPFGGCGFGNSRSSCGGTFRTSHTTVTLPAGTALFSSAAATSSYATLRAPWVATMQDAGEIPDTPVGWRLMYVSDAGVRWSLSAWLRVPPEQLRSLR